MLAWPNGGSKTDDERGHQEGARTQHGAAGATPVAALTAHASAATRDQVLAAGFQIHITKPADPGQLVKAVQTLARGGKALEALDVRPGARDDDTARPASSGAGGFPVHRIRECRAADIRR